MGRIAILVFFLVQIKVIPNKIGALGYMTNNNYFSSIPSKGNRSYLPVGFSTENGSFAMPMPPAIQIEGDGIGELMATYSSPAAPNLSINQF